MKFRKKPVVIEAFLLGADHLPDWFMDRVSEGTITLHGERFDRIESAEIGTLEGVMLANRGDYVIQGVKGEIYPCKPEIFLLTYEGI